MFWALNYFIHEQMQVALRPLCVTGDVFVQETEGDGINKFK